VCSSDLPLNHLNALMVQKTVLHGLENRFRG